MNNLEFWQKHYETQRGIYWCGVATIRMIFSATGINVSQEEIAKQVLIPWWGVSRDVMLAYFSKYFKIVNFKNGTLKDISYHLKKKNIVVVDWWDDLIECDFDNGHYTVVVDYNGSARTITLADSSEGMGLRNIPTKKFLSKWYDYLDLNNRLYDTGWMLWIDPKSRIV